MVNLARSAVLCCTMGGVSVGAFTGSAESDSSNSVGIVSVEGSVGLSAAVSVCSDGFSVSFEGDVSAVLLSCALKRVGQL